MLFKLIVLIFLISSCRELELPKEQNESLAKEGPTQNTSSKNDQTFDEQIKPTNKFSLTFNFLSHFQISNVSKIYHESVKTFEDPLENILIYLNYENNLGTQSLLAIVDKDNKIIFQTSFSQIFSSLKQLYVDKKNNIFLRGTPLNPIPYGEKIMMFTPSLNLSWQKDFSVLKDAGIYMQEKNGFLYFFTHSGANNQQVLAYKIVTLSSEVVEVIPHVDFNKPIKSFSTTLSALMATKQSDEEIFYYWISAQADDSENWNNIISFSYDLDLFLSDKQIEPVLIDIAASQKSQICIDKLGLMYTYHPERFILQIISPEYGLLLEKNIKDELKPHIPSNQLQLLCNKQYIQLVGSVQMNDINTDSINILVNFSKTDGSLIDSQILYMQNYQSTDFSISLGSNSVPHFFDDQVNDSNGAIDFLITGHNFNPEKL